MKLLAVTLFLAPLLHTQAQSQVASKSGSQSAMLCDQLRALTQDASVASAHWGLQLTDLDGTSLCSINEAQLFRPASNNKLFTTAAALALLGPMHTVTTRLEAEGAIKGPTLHGNLLILGAGDANFGSHNIPYLPPAARPKTTAPDSATIDDIESFAAAVVARGIRSIRGDVIGDDSYLAWQPYPPDWEIDDTVYGYGAPVSALTIHDNAIDFLVSPGAPGAAGPGNATISFTPRVAYYQLDTSVSSLGSAGGCDDRVQYGRAAGSMTLAISGDMAPGGQPCRQAIAIQDPAEYAALALKLALERRGVQVSGRARAKHYDPKLTGGVHPEHPDHDPGLIFLFSQPLPALQITCEAQTIYDPGAPPPLPRIPLAAHTSPTLLEDITYTNKVSQNQHAELMMRTLGPVLTCENSQRAGLHIVREFLLHAGVQPQDIALYDGSGLSTHDLVTPRALARLLAYAAAQPWFTAFRSSLPEAGVDGSLTTRFKDLPSGRLFAKTGTLGESRALSGYVTDTAGRQFIFSIMVDTHLPGTSAGAPPDRVIMDRIVHAIAGH